MAAPPKRISDSAQREPSDLILALFAQGDENSPESIVAQQLREFEQQKRKPVRRLLESQLLWLNAFEDDPFLPKNGDDRRVDANKVDARPDTEKKAVLPPSKRSPAGASTRPASPLRTMSGTKLDKPLRERPAQREQKERGVVSDALENGAVRKRDEHGGSWEALLLFALMVAGKRLSRSAGSENAELLKSAHETVRYYTGRDSDPLTLLAQEKGMRVAVDKDGRPRWAAITEGKDAGQKLVFTWEADGRLTIDIEDKKGFVGRISSRAKIEFSDDKKTIKSADKTFLVTYADGSTKQWHGELHFDREQKQLRWAPEFQERNHPLDFSRDHAADHLRMTSLQVRAIDTIYNSPENKGQFTFRELQLLKQLHMQLMEGNVVGLQKAFQNLCEQVTAPARRQALIRRFAGELYMLTNIRLEEDSKRGLCLIYTDSRSDTQLVIPASKEIGLEAHIQGQPDKKVAAHDVMLNMVREERASRERMTSMREAQAAGTQHEWSKAEIAKLYFIGAHTVQSSFQEIDAKRHLTSAEKTLLSQLKRAFVDADMKSFTRLVQAFDNNPQALKPVMDELIKDLVSANPNFKGEYKVSTLLGKDVGACVLGDADHQLKLTTDLGDAPFVVRDDKNRSPESLLIDLSKEVVATLKATVPADALPTKHTPMSGFLDTTGLWNHNYLEVLDAGKVNEIELRMSFDYNLGAPAHMQRYLDRVGQVISGWAAHYQDLNSRLVRESGAAASHNATRDRYLAVRDEVLAKLGLNHLGPYGSLQQLQTGVEGVLDFLQLGNAKGAGIADVPEKIKVVQTLQRALLDYEALYEKHNTAEAQLALMNHQVLKKLSGRTLPDGITIERLNGDPGLLRTYLNHADAAAAGIEDIAGKVKKIDDFLKLQQEKNEFEKRSLQPARKAFEAVRDALLKRLGADKIPSGCTDVELRDSARALKEFLDANGEKNGITAVKEKLKVIDEFVAAQERYDAACKSTDELVERRRLQLQRIVDDLAKEHGIPKTVVVVTNDPHGTALGSYDQGTLHIARNLLLSGAQETVAEVVYHEMVHGEQQFKFVSLFADQYKQQHGRDPTVQELQELYKEKMTVKLDAYYAQQLLKLRNGRALSAEDTAKAEVLWKAWKNLGSIGTQYDRAATEFLGLNKVIEDLSGPRGPREVERIIDSYLNSKDAQETIPDLPGRHFQSAEALEKDHARLRELVRDRVAFLGGESKEWDANRARDVLVEVLQARQQEINRWREERWAHYGGPDKEHEWDAQVIGKMVALRGRAQFAKPPALRAADEMERVKLDPVLRDTMPEGTKRVTEEDGSISYSFDKEQVRKVATTTGEVEFLGVRLKDGEVTVLLRDAKGRLVSSKALAEACVETVRMTYCATTLPPNVQEFLRNPALRAELIARLLQHLPTRNLEALHMLSEIGGPKFGVVPESLKRDNLTERDIEQYLKEKIPAEAPNWLELAGRELTSLLQLKDDNLRAAIESYRKKSLDRVAEPVFTLVRDLSNGNVPLHMSVSDYVKARNVEIANSLFARFGRPENAAMEIILKACTLPEKERAAYLRKEAAKSSEDAAFWEMVQRGCDFEGLEKRRQFVVAELERRGIKLSEVRADQTFSLPLLEQRLKETEGSVVRPLSQSEPLLSRLVHPEERDRFLVRSDGYGGDRDVAERVEVVIARARQRLARGEIRSHAELEKEIAEGYAQALRATGQGSEILEFGGRRAMDAQTGRLYTHNFQVLPKHHAYVVRIAELVRKGDGRHTASIEINGRKINLVTTHYVKDQRGLPLLCWLPPSDTQGLALVAERKEQLFKEMQALGKQPRSQENLAAVMRKAAELEWLSAQSWDYWRGSGGIEQAKVRALLDALGIETGRYRRGVDPNLEALTTPLDEYVKRYSGLYENVPRYYPRDLEPCNRYSRALADLRITPEKGASVADGTLFKLREPKKVKLSGEVVTVIGVKAKTDGTLAVVVEESRGHESENVDLARAHERQMDRILAREPIGRLAVQSNRSLAAAVIARVLETTSQSDLDGRLIQYMSSRQEAKDLFTSIHLDSIVAGDMNDFHKLTSSLINGELEGLRLAVEGLDTVDKKGTPPRTQFERMAQEFARRLSALGLEAPEYRITDGVGVITLKCDGVKILLRTDDSNKFEVYRGAEKQPAAVAEATVAKMAERIIANIDRARGQVQLLGPNQSFELVREGKTERLLSLGGSTKLIVAIAQPSPPERSVRGSEQSAKPRTETVRPEHLTAGRYVAVQHPYEQGKSFVLDTTERKVFEVGERHPLTWEVQLIERPDFRVLEAEVVIQNLIEAAIGKERAPARPVFAVGDPVILPPRLGENQALVLGKLGDRIIVQGKGRPIYAVEEATSAPKAVVEAVKALDGKIAPQAKFECAGYLDITVELWGKVPHNARALLNMADGKVYHVGVQGENIIYFHDAMSAVIDARELTARPYRRRSVLGAPVDTPKAASEADRPVVLPTLADWTGTARQVVSGLGSVDLEWLRSTGATADRASEVIKKVQEALKITPSSQNLSASVRDIALVLLMNKLTPSPDNIERAKALANEVDKLRREYGEPTMPMKAALELLSLRAQKDPIFVALTDKSFVEETSKALAEQVLPRMETVTDPAERAKIIETQLKDIFKDVLNLTNDELPTSLKNLKVQVTDDVTAPRMVRDKDGPVLQVSKTQIQKEPAAVLNHVFAISSGAALVDVMKLPAQAPYVEHALRPVVKFVLEQAGPTIRAKQRELDLARKSAPRVVSSETRPDALVKREIVTMSWDGHDSITFGGAEKIALSKEIEKEQKRTAAEIEALKERIAELKKDEKSNAERIKELSAQLARLEFEHKIVHNVQEALAGKYGADAQTKAKEVVKETIDKGIRAESERGEHRPGITNRATALTMVVMAVAGAYAGKFGVGAPPKRYLHSLRGS